MKTSTATKTPNQAISGHHLIAGQWHTGTSSFTSTGTGHTIQNADNEAVNQAVQAATDAFSTYGQSTSAERALLLRTIADEIELLGEEITAVCTKESNLPVARLTGERGRTTHQLSVFASHIENGLYLQRSEDAALPDRSPIPRPALKKMMRPYGPVAIFGASNFPLAFSTAGGDTASALAAGCPVVVKGHPAHPATSELVAQAILAAIKKCDMHPGIFSLIQDSGIQAAQELVTHPDITAVGFTGSLQAGRSLFDMCQQRPVPIPFYGEMGSLNPVFILPDALAQSCQDMAEGWVDSLNMGVGQFCTKPGVLILPEGQQGDQFIAFAKQKLRSVTAQKMLTPGIANAYIKGNQTISQEGGITSLFTTDSQVDAIHPNIYSTSANNWLSNTTLQHEIFGPYAMVIRSKDEQQTLDLAKQLPGQLTCTLFMTPDDHVFAQTLLPIFEQKAGRILANGWPTGVEVAESMVHGGPYPASTAMGTTSVGSTAIQRFLKPICYQNLPQALLPKELQQMA